MIHLKIKRKCSFNINTFCCFLKWAKKKEKHFVNQLKPSGTNEIKEELFVRESLKMRSSNNNKTKKKKLKNEKISLKINVCCKCLRPHSILCDSFHTPPAFQHTICFCPHRLQFQWQVIYSVIPVYGWRMKNMGRANRWKAEAEEKTENINIYFFCSNSLNNVSRHLNTWRVLKSG